MIIKSRLGSALKILEWVFRAILKTINILKLKHQFSTTKLKQWKKTLTYQLDIYGSLISDIYNIKYFFNILNYKYKHCHVKYIILFI